VHAQVSATARPLVGRTLGSLVEELARVALEAFAKVERFGMGGMLQVRRLSLVLSLASRASMCGVQGCCQ